MSRHYHVAMGEQGQPNFRLIRFDEKAEAADLFLNLSSEIFKSYKQVDRITIENNMYKALDVEGQILFDGGQKLMSLVYSCESEDCMLSTYN